MHDYLEDFLRRLAGEGGARSFGQPPGMAPDAFEVLVRRLEEYAKQGLLEVGKKHPTSRGGRHVDRVGNVRLTPSGIERWGRQPDV